MDYEIRYTNSRYPRLRIKGGRPYVTAPSRYKNLASGTAAIERFVRANENWINEKIAEYNAVCEKMMPGLMDMAAFYMHGVRMPAYADDKLKRIKLEPDLLRIPRGITRKEAASQLKRAYMRIAETALHELLDIQAARTGYRYTEFGLTNAAGKWGSCAKNGKILLNWRLVLIDPSLAVYVAVHELCHTVHLDHSKEFWASVERVIPESKTLRTKLNKLSFVTDYLR